MTDAKPQVFTVSQLNNFVKSYLDDNEYLSRVFVSGEISGFKAHYSGHYYMTIKDETASVKAVMFAGNASKLRFMPENGLKVIIFGSVSLYPRDGSYQLYITSMQPQGAGELYLAFEQLKEKLLKEGLFDEKYKKPLPFLPKRIGVVTSETGAAVRDIINVISRRCPICEIILKPVLVQGDGASKQIADAVTLFNKYNAADVLIVGRGGGSQEDLRAFNEEIVARSVFNSKIPVISAVGHETDFTICDFVADRRAPTPSAAAELAVPDIQGLKNYLLSQKNHLFYLFDGLLTLERERLLKYEDSAVFKNPLVKIQDKKEEISLYQKRLYELSKQMSGVNKQNISYFAGKLNALNPLSILERGYSVTYKDNVPIDDVKKVSVGDNIKVQFKNGTICAEVLKTDGEQNENDL